jgi:hypothetical protein
MNRVPFSQLIDEVKLPKREERDDYMHVIESNGFTITITTKNEAVSSFFSQLNPRTGERFRVAKWIVEKCSENGGSFRLDKSAKHYHNIGLTSIKSTGAELLID